MKRGEIVGGGQFWKKLNKERKRYREVYKQFIQQLKIKGLGNYKFIVIYNIL